MFLPGCDAILDYSIWGHARYVYVSNLCLLYLWKIRRRALRDPTFDLKAMLLEGRRDQQSKYQAQQIESKVEPTVGETNKLEQGNKCRNCGREYPHSSACPAKGKTCNKSGK